MLLLLEFKFMLLLVTLSEILEFLYTFQHNMYSFKVRLVDNFCAGMLCREIQCDAIHIHLQSFYYIILYMT